MGRKRIAGKLLLVGAGMGGLALLMFVFLPWLTRMQADQERLGSEAIIAQAPRTPEASEKDQGVTGGAAEEGLMPPPSPVVAVRDNGEEIAVVFPAVGVEEAPDATPVLDDRPAVEEQRAVQASTAEGLPPVLSAEEVAAAMAGLEFRAQDAGEPVAVTQATPAPIDEGSRPDAEGVRPGESAESWTAPDAEPAGAVQRDGRQPEIAPVTDSDGSHHVEWTLPPASATREVQGLLEALGYAPGPLDGIWGERTAGAWGNFARDAVERHTRTESGRSQTGRVVDSPVAESPTPSGATVEAEVDGAGQVGETRPLTGLPPRPVVVPRTLRGVMGYRMPLVSRQAVPDQIVSGVLIPAHTTFVILKPGHWELVGLDPGEVERLRDASARREPRPPMEAVKRGWNPLRLFRKRELTGHAK